MPNSVTPSESLQTASEFDSRIYKRSRTAYIWDCTFEYFVSLLMADSFLAKLLGNLGFSDSQIGILSSFISLAFLFQLCAIPVVRNITDTKRFAVLFHTSSQAVFVFLYLVPFLPIAAAVKKVLVPVCLLAAYFGNYFVTNTIYAWGNSFVEPKKRGSFQASKEMVSLISGVVVSFAVGIIMDRFDTSGNLYGGFLFSAIAIAVFSGCDLVCLLLIKNRLRDLPKSDRVPLREVMKNTFGNKNYRHLLLLTIVYTCGQYASLGFVGNYKISELAFDLTVVQLINIGGQLARFAVSKPFGRFADKTSYAHCETLGLIIMAASFLALALTSPSSRWLIIAYVLLYNMSLAGTNQNMLMMTYNYVDAKYYAEATAIKSGLAGFCGFLTSLLCGKLLSYVQTDGLSVFGINFCGQQLLGIISLIICLCAIIISKFVVEKQSRIGC